MTKCRLLNIIGLRYFCGYYWEDSDGYHRVEIPITEQQFEDKGLDLLKERGYDRSLYKCNCHGTQVPSFAKVVCGSKHLFDSEDGLANKPGDMYYAPWMHQQMPDGSIRCMYWDNCNDPRGHLVVVLPTGRIFDTDARASNCNRPKDRTHRCWEKKGDPPNITVGGPSSDNGVGSIGMTDWHGYLTNGVLHN